MNNKQKELLNKLLDKFQILQQLDAQTIWLLENLESEAAVQLATLMVSIVNNLKLKQIMKTLDDVLSDVQDEGTVIDSAVTLIEGISQQLKDALANGADPAKIQEIIDSIDSKKQVLAQAVQANTPATTQTPVSGGGVANLGTQQPGPASSPAEGNKHDVVLGPGGPVSVDTDAGKALVDAGHPVIAGSTQTDPVTGNTVAKPSVATSGSNTEANSGGPGGANVQPSNLDTPGQAGPLTQQPAPQVAGGASGGQSIPGGGAQAGQEQGTTQTPATNG